MTLLLTVNGGWTIDALKSASVVHVVALSAGAAVVPAGSSSRTWLPGKVTTPERRI